MPHPRPAYPAGATTKIKPIHHYGALFLGWRAAEVLGDYGVGPNHVLPTGGTARARGGLSVERPEYVPWTDVEQVDFDRPPSP